jgi:hypothetical protein
VVGSGVESRRWPVKPGSTLLGRFRTVRVPLKGNSIQLISTLLRRKTIDADKPARNGAGKFHARRLALPPERIHKVGEVFGISRELPVNYVLRKGIDDKLIDNLTRDHHIVIFGSSKQGKTCLRKSCLNDDDYIVVSWRD